MNLEDHVVSLELAKRLKELGVKKHSYFYWERCPDVHNTMILSYVELHDITTGEWGSGHDIQDQEHYSAFTVAELGEMLPYNIKRDAFTNYDLIISKDWISYEDYPHDDPKTLIFIKDKKEADARAKMLIYLIENRFIEVDKINDEFQRSL